MSTKHIQVRFRKESEQNLIKYRVVLAIRKRQSNFLELLASILYCNKMDETEHSRTVVTIDQFGYVVRRKRNRYVRACMFT